MKKGSVGSILDWLIALFFTLCVLLTLFILVSSYSSKDINTSKLKAYDFILHIYYSDLINVKDSVGVHPGFIDVNKLNNIDYDNLGAKITLYYDDLSSKWYPFKPIYVNKDLYDSMKSFAVNGVKGKGGAIGVNATIPVRLYIDNNLVSGFLFIDVVVPNS